MVSVLGSSDEERLEVLDDAGDPTGVLKPRHAVHRDGDWHRSFHLWIVKDRRQVLLQRRSSSKDLEPNKCDVSVGGHFAPGEGSGGVLREAEEEIGLTLHISELHSMGTRKSERFYPGATDREFQEVYVAECSRPLEEYALNCAEVYVLYEVPIDRAIALYREGAFVPAPGIDCHRRVNNALLVEDDLISQGRGDLVDALMKLRQWLQDAAE